MIKRIAVALLICVHSIFGLQQKIVDRIQSRPRSVDREFQYLHFVYQQFVDKPVGGLDAKTIKRMQTALPLYAKRRTETAARQAKELLARLIEEHKAVPEPLLSVKHFNAAMDAYAKVGEPRQVQKLCRDMINYDLEPDCYSYGILINAWSRSRRPEAAETVMKVLQYMERHTNWKISNTVYNSVLHSILHSSDPYRVEKAEAIVERMRHRQSVDEVGSEPDIVTYQTLMSTISRSRRKDSPEKCMELLNFLDRHENLRPNAHCFAAAIHAWARSSRRERAEKAYELFLEMQKRYIEASDSSCRPNVVIYTAVINACAVERCENAFRIANHVMKTLATSDHGNPNFLTYAAFLDVCATTLDSEGRDSVLREVFYDCCRDGCVGKMVLKKLEEASSAELYRELTRDGVSEDWRRHVRGERV